MRALFTVLFLAAVAAPPSAQERGVLGVIEGRQVTPGGYYFNAQPGEPVTRVHVWGRVLRPGVYEVGAGFGLAGVLTLAGVASDDGEPDGDPELYLTLSRAGETEPVYQASLAAFVQDATPPELLYGDVLEMRAIGVARVGIWGAVARPGIYELGPTFDARAALALAGGPELQTLRPSESRETTVTIYGESRSSPRFEGSIEAFLTGDALQLEDGDVLQVESSLDQGWATRDTLTVAGILTSAAIAVAQFLRLLSLD